MNYKDRIKSYRNQHIDAMIDDYQGRWKECGRGRLAMMDAYFNTNDRGFTRLAADRLPASINELEEFSACLLEAGIKEFIITEESTALMTIIIHLMRFDWVITDTFEDENAGYAIRGLKLKHFA